MSGADALKFLSERNCGVLSLSDGEVPYAVPLNYHFDEGQSCLYFHGAREGRKISIIEKNPPACFTVYTQIGLKPADVTCKIGLKYQSVIVTGEIEILKMEGEKSKALTNFVQAMTGKKVELPPSAVANTNILKLKIAEITGKEDPG